ncbi:MAG: DUF1467 family protein [Methylobacteriaceae bacterium]|nr:DUF1467 family protein [Methylobacteriaceae bacterium]
MAVAVFFTIWWIVLFVTLPFGVRSLHETGEPLEGADPGAPVAPQLAKKALWTTGLAILVFAGLVAFMNLTA